MNLSVLSEGPKFKNIKKIFNSFYYDSIFSSLKPKTQMSFSDQNLLVVCHCCHRHCKLFAFSSYPPKPLRLISTKLDKKHFWGRGFKFDHEWPL